jgi:hypothetical protein
MSTMPPSAPGPVDTTMPAAPDTLTAPPSNASPDDARTTESVDSNDTNLDDTSVDPTDDTATVPPDTLTLSSAPSVDDAA